MLRYKVFLLLSFFVFIVGIDLNGQEYLTFVYASDCHYGLTREFRGYEASSEEVNAAMIEVIRHLSETDMPLDGGVLQGKRIQGLDFIVNGGDIANRMEDGVQTATESWRQFSKAWLSEPLAYDDEGNVTPIYILAGNHDISNAIGYTKPLYPKTDAECAAQIYNYTMQPTEPISADEFDNTVHKIKFYKIIDGIGFAFCGMWLDSSTRQWLNDVICDTVPTIVFTHDEPDIEAKHLINPHRGHRITSRHGFENLVADTSSVLSQGETAVAEHRQLANFLSNHPTIKAYFHGNTNYNEFYIWHGPDNNIKIPVFRVDSPMKGEYSSSDESLLSFQVVVIDLNDKRMTVRECLWNTDNSPIAWGASSTIEL